MSAPVDVLADLRKIADGEGDTELLGMRCYTAIAELIEVVKSANSQISTAQAFVRAMELQGAGLPMSAQLAPELSQTYRDLRAALRAVGGA